MKGQTILFISDMRQVYLAEILTKKGICVRCLDVRNRERAGTQLEKLETYLAEAGRLILPVPVTKIPDQGTAGRNIEKRCAGGCAGLWRLFF